MSRTSPSAQRILLALYDAHIKPDAAHKAIETGMALVKAEREQMTPRQLVLAEAGLPPTAELFHETAARKGVPTNSRERYWEGSISDRDRTRLIKSTSLRIEKIDAMDRIVGKEAAKATELPEAEMEKVIRRIIEKAGFRLQEILSAIT